MKLLYVSRFLSMMLSAIFVATSVHAMDQRGMDQKKQAAEVIQKALSDFRKLTRQQKIVRKLNFKVETKLDVKKTEFWHGWKRECHLLHEKSGDKYGRIIYFLSNGFVQVDLSRLKVKSKYRGCGVGEYLFNCMIDDLYAINRQRKQNGEKTYKRVTWTAKPLASTIMWWDGDEEVLERLIKFYISLGAQVESKGRFSAEMYFDLET